MKFCVFFDGEFFTKIYLSINSKSDVVKPFQPNFLARIAQNNPVKVENINNNNNLVFGYFDFLCRVLDN